MSDNLEVVFGQYAQNVAGDDAAAVMRARYGSAEPKAEKPAAAEGAEEGSGAARVAKDIIQGGIETPRALYTGVRSAAQETLTFALEAVDPLASWLEEKMPLQGVTPEFMQKGDLPVPKLDDPESITGGMVKGVSQFLAGFLGAGKIKALKAWKPASKAGKAAKAAGQGAVADAVVFDPYEERLSDLVQQYPALQNPVTAYLEAQPDDSAAEGRFKNAVEGLSLGVVAEGFHYAVRAIRAKRIAQAAADSTATAPQTIIEATPVKPKPLAVLGDKDGDLFNAYDEAGEKLDTAGKKTSDVTPGMVFGREEPRLGDVGEVEGAGAVAPKVNLDAAGDLGGKPEPIILTPEQIQAAKKKAKATVQAELKAGRITPEHAFRGTNEEELRAIAATGELQVGKDAEGRPGISATTAGDGQFAAYGEGFGIIVPPGKHTPSGRMREVLVDEKTNPSDLMYVVDGKTLTYKELQERFPKVKSAEDAEAEAWLKAQVGVGNAPSKPKRTAPAKVEINFARINTPEDVQEVMERMVNMSAKDINAERRGVRSWEQTKLSADQKDAFAILMARRTGEPLNAEQSLAARRLWVTSAEKLAEVAKSAVEAPTAENLFAFRKMVATHYAIQKEVIAARTETARALNAWAITAEGNETLAKQMKNLLDANGGETVARELADRINKLSNAGMAGELEKMVEGGLLAKTRNAVRQVWVNALLTNPASHVANVASNFLTIGQAIYERKAASLLAQMLGDESGVVSGEALAMMHGSVLGARDALRYANKRLRTGQVDLPAGLERAKVESGNALSSAAWDVAADTPMGKFLDFVDVGTRLPGTAMGFSDDMFKSIGYRMELHALAHRYSVQEAAAGKIAAGTERQRAAEILANPPEEVKLEAIDAALYRTFNSEPAKVAERLATAWQNIPVFGVLTLPFRNTPINVMTYGFERTPLAPLIGKWRDDMTAGGARAQMATAKFATGNMILLAAMDMVMQGQVTGAGPQRPGEKQLFQRQGKQRYSVKFGDTWYSYNRVDPAGTLLGLAADIIEITMNGLTEQTDMEKYVTASALALGNAVTSKTWMSGIADLFEALGDKERYGEGYVKKLVSGVAVPPGVMAARRVTDPYLRYAQDIGDSIRNRTPGLSESLPAMRDLWGREVSFRSELGSAYDLLSPAYAKRENPEPIDTELERIEFYPTLPGKSFSVGKVEVDLTSRPDIYARYIELAGNELKHPAWGMGAKELLNAIVSGEHNLSTVYELRKRLTGNEGAQSYLGTIISQYRNLARRQLVEEYPELDAQVTEGREQRLERLQQ